MADRRPRRAGPVWAWVLGLVLVALGVWLVLDMALDGDEAAERPAEPAAELGPAAPEGGVLLFQEPAEDVERALAASEAVAAPVPLGALVPLGPADTGARVSFRGARVGRATAEGAWIRTEAGSLVFVRVAGAGEAAAALRRATLAGTGVIRHDGTGRLDALARRAGLGARERSGLVEGYYIETTVDRLDGG